MHQVIGVALRVAAAVALIVAAPDTPPHPQAHAGCDGWNLRSGACPIANVGKGSFDLSNSRHSAGGGGSGGHGGQPDMTSPDSSSTAQPDPMRYCYRTKYGGPSRCTATLKKPKKHSHGPVTLSDLVSFRPAPGTDHSQPTGWALVGLDTNFYATTPSELQHGTLLGQRADVRFTPVTWHWTYGDGTTATHTTAGATWAAQHIHEFDPTATSHIFHTRGNHTIDLDIQFAVEYRYADNDWTPVEGTIDARTNQLTLTTETIKTVLVNQNCNQNPNGPGC
jgi:hypothetical protein